MSIAIFGRKLVAPYKNIYDLPIQSMKLNMLMVEKEVFSSVQVFGLNDIFLKMMYFKIENVKDDGSFHSYFMGL